MTMAPKPIRLSTHARGYMVRRGFSESEVVDAIRSGPWRSARGARLETHKDFAYGREWNGMIIRYDAEVDALAIIFRETTVTTGEVAEGITAEYDEHGQVVGLEVLDAAQRFGDPNVLRQVTLEGVGLSMAGSHSH